MALVAGGAVALTALGAVVFLLRDERQAVPAIPVMGPDESLEPRKIAEVPQVPAAAPRPVTVPTRAPAPQLAPPLRDDAAMAAVRAQAAKEAALAKQQAAYEDWAHREAMKQIAEDEARARSINGGSAPRAAERAPYGATSRVSPDARRRVSITMYSTSWCGVCKRARRYMDGAQIPYVDRDVEMDSSAALEARRLNPRGGVPTFDVAGTPLIGFDAGSLERAIDAAAARL
jgi:glutaredoxin